MDISDIVIRPAADGDKESILALGPRLAIGVAPWRNQAEALAVGRRWLEDSIAAAAAAGDGAVLVAIDNSKRRGREGDVAGVISIRPSRHFTGERDGYIGELAVREDNHHPAFWFFVLLVVVAAGVAVAYFAFKR